MSKAFIPKNLVPELRASAGGVEETNKEEMISVLKSMLKKPKKERVATSTNVRIGAGLAPDDNTKVEIKKKHPPAVAATQGSINMVGEVKRFPGNYNLLTLRALAWSSTVVYSIVTYRRHQLTKKDLIIVPKDETEPHFRLSLFDYDSSDIIHLPYLTEEEKVFVIKIFQKIDPNGKYRRKREVFNKAKDQEKLTQNEIRLMQKLDEKHWAFYMKRRRDVKAILNFLNNPDPYFSEESSWYYLLSMILEDLLLLDRGVLIKTRNEKGQLVAVTPVDGTSVYPRFDKNGYIKSYVQMVEGDDYAREYDKNDVIIFRMNFTPDRYMYGYGIPNMYILYRTVLADIFIDKGNIDYYRKGGSVPEGFLVVEPPGNTDEGYVQFDKEMLDGIQRQIQSILMSDFTQVPLLSGGKFTWIDLKGKRRDMQFKELAEYLTRKICAVFQVSPQDVGVISDVNRSTAEVQASLTRSKGLETLARTISYYITHGIIDELREEKDLRLWWKEDDIQRAKEEWIIHQQQLASGVMTINELRAQQGKDPYPWGDTPFMSLKNWEPPPDEEEQMQGMAPGIPPIPGAQPPQIPGTPTKGMEKLIPGQIPGTSFGTPPGKLKSVLEARLEEIQRAEEELDVTPLVENLVLPPGYEKNDEETKLLQAADIIAEKYIDDIGFANDSTVYLFTKSPWLSENSVAKVLMQVFKPEVEWSIVRSDNGEVVVRLSVPYDDLMSGNSKLSDYVYAPGSTESKKLQDIFTKLSIAFKPLETVTLIVTNKNKKDFDLKSLADWIANIGDPTVLCEFAEKLPKEFEKFEGFEDHAFLLHDLSLLKDCVDEEAKKKLLSALTKKPVDKVTKEIFRVAKKLINKFPVEEIPSVIDAQSFEPIEKAKDTKKDEEKREAIIRAVFSLTSGTIVSSPILYDLAVALWKELFGKEFDEEIQRGLALVAYFHEKVKEIQPSDKVYEETFSSLAHVHPTFTLDREASELKEHYKSLISAALNAPLTEEAEPKIKNAIRWFVANLASLNKRYEVALRELAAFIGVEDSSEWLVEHVAESAEADEISSLEELVEKLAVDEELRRRLSELARALKFGEQVTDVELAITKSLLEAEHAAS